MPLPCTTLAALCTCTTCVICRAESCGAPAGFPGTALCCRPNHTVAANVSSGLQGRGAGRRAAGLDSEALESGVRMTQWWLESVVQTPIRLKRKVNSRKQRHCREVGFDGPSLLMRIALTRKCSARGIYCTSLLRSLSAFRRTRPPQYVWMW